MQRVLAMNTQGLLMDISAYMHLEALFQRCRPVDLSPRWPYTPLRHPARKRIAACIVLWSQQRHEAVRGPWPCASMFVARPVDIRC